MQNLKSIIEKFSDARVLVIGDIMLDQYWWGSVERISPEAPVPVVKLEKKSLVVGGAANVAANIAGLGANAVLIGAVGIDDEAESLKKLLHELNISSDYLVQINNRPTTLKTRIVAHNQHVVRIDQENNAELGEEQQDEIFAQFKDVIHNIDVLIISDYAKGVLSEDLVGRLIKYANDVNKLVLVDPKGQNYQKYTGAFLLTPNRFEAAQSCYLPLNDVHTIEKAGNQLVNNLNLKSVLITQGENGMTLFEKSKTKSFHLSALARKVYDVTGAGDTVIAVLGTALAAGADLREAAEIANISAGIVVEEIGTTTITDTKLNRFFGQI